jgi:hypothetical protein
MTHVAAWLVHSLVISLVLAAAAAAWELSARWSGRPVRWAWLGALAGSVSLPLLVRLVPAQAWPQALPSAVPTVLALDPIIVGDATVALSAHSGGWSAGVVGVALWAVMSAVALLLVALLFVQLRLARRGWRTTELDGSLVYVTRDSGPAAIGIRRGIVLVPAWALEMRPELRSLLLLHEHEHIRAGDPRLLLAGLVLLSLMPWNPVLWLQLLRLRNAIELDCDGRVLRAGADPRRYGSLLLEVGRHRSGMAFVLATFAEPHMFLEQRIRRITQWPLERRPRRAAAFSLLALALCATALSARDPLRPALPTAAGPDALTAAAVEQGTERHRRYGTRRPRDRHRRGPWHRHCRGPRHHERRRRGPWHRHCRGPRHHERRRRGPWHRHRQSAAPAWCPVRARPPSIRRRRHPRRRRRRRRRRRPRRASPASPLMPGRRSRP